MTTLAASATPPAGTAGAGALARLAGSALPYGALAPGDRVQLLHADGSRSVWHGAQRLPGEGAHRFTAVELPEDLVLRFARDLPLLSRADTEAALELEARSHSPFSAEDLAWGATWRDTAGSRLVNYVTGGGGGVLVPIVRCSSFDAYAVGAGSSCKAPLPTSDSQVHHFLHVRVDGQRVTVTPIDSTGRRFDVQTYDFG